MSEILTIQITAEADKAGLLHLICDGKRITYSLGQVGEIGSWVSARARDHRDAVKDERMRYAGLTEIEKLEEKLRRSGRIT